MNIYIGYRLPSTDRELLESIKQPEDNFIFSQDLPENEREIGFSKAEVAFGNIPPKWIDKSENLRWLQLSSTGFNAYLSLDWRNLPQVQVTNLRDFYGQPVAETAIAGIMSFYRSVNTLTNLQTQKKWVGLALRPEMDLLYQKKVLLLGAGAIGEIIQKILEAFSCEVTIIRKTASPNLNDLESLLPNSNIIVCALPENKETTGIFDAKKISLMNKEALFVNVGRGSVVDEESLIDALRQSKIKGAILDVTQTEPLPEENSLWDLPNVILTQHTGGGYRDEKTDIVKTFIDNLHRYRKGEKLHHIVDFKRGY
jgi:glyoxylate/hydroxypyruvate reductase